MSTVSQDVFPHDVLIGCNTALVIFCAAFGGRQDAEHIAEAGLTATCVDIDGEKMEVLARTYPQHWDFETVDAYAFAEFATLKGRQWDVVTLDPFTPDFDRCADNVATWCRLARRAVIVGTGVATLIVAPPGWEVTRVQQRSSYHGGVYWTVLERV